MDGPYLAEERDWNAPFRGSRNQRLILVQESLAAGKASLLRRDKWNLSCNRTQDMVPYLTLPGFGGDQGEPWVRLVFTTRLGGVSTGPYAELNLGMTTGDDPALVAENRRLLCSTLGLDVSQLSIVKQVHSDRVVVVDQARRSDSPVIEADAQVTAIPGIPLFGTVCRLPGGLPVRPGAWRHRAGSRRLARHGGGDRREDGGGDGRAVRHAAGTLPCCAGAGSGALLLRGGGRSGRGCPGGFPGGVECLAPAQQGWGMRGNT